MAEVTVGSQGEHQTARTTADAVSLCPGYTIEVTYSSERHGSYVTLVFMRYALP